MGDHDDLLAQGPREAPEPETAEQRTHRLSGRAVGGGILGGGAAAAKLGLVGGGLGKALLWMVAWNGAFDSAHAFGWIGLVLFVGILLTFLVLRGSRRSRS